MTQRRRYPFSVVPAPPRQTNKAPCRWPGPFQGECFRAQAVSLGRKPSLSALRTVCWDSRPRIHIAPFPGADHAPCLPNTWLQPPQALWALLCAPQSVLQPFTVSTFDRQLRCSVELNAFSLSPSLSLPPSLSISEAGSLKLRDLV